MRKSYKPGQYDLGLLDESQILCLLLAVVQVDFQRGGDEALHEGRVAEIGWLQVGDRRHQVIAGWKIAQREPTIRARTRELHTARALSPERPIGGEDDDER